MRRLLVLLAFAPALLTGLLVAHHAENVPVWDDFDRVPLLESFAEGTLSFQDLYAPHIDHRILVPRLFILANAKLTGGNLVWENALVFVIVLATALALAALLRRSVPLTPAAGFAAVLGVNALVLSPLQWENFLWAIQTAFVLPMASLVVALLVLETRLPMRARFALTLTAALVGTHSFSHGLLIWLAVPAWILLRRPDARSGAPGDRRAFLIAWAIAAAAVLIPFFALDYRAATSHQYGVGVGNRTPIVAYAGEALTRPGLVARFYLSMVGGPLARLGPWAPADVAWVWGLLVHGLLAVGVGTLLGARDRALWNRSVPWLILAGATLVACALAALGRAVPTNGLYALAPRYVSVSQYALVALVALGALLAARGPRSRAVVLAVAVVLAAPVAAGWKVGIQGMRAWQTARLEARTSLLFIRDFAPRYILRLDSDYDAVRANADRMDRHGYLDPPLARDARPDAFEIAEPGGNAADGGIDRARAAGQRLVVHGHAALAPGRNAHGVLLAVQGGQGLRVVAVGEGRSRPAGAVYLHDHLHSEVELDPDAPTGNWKAKLELARLPAAPSVHIEAYAVDAERMRLHRLPQDIRVSRDPELRVELVPAR
jgi:hypothetical protein